MILKLLSTRDRDLEDAASVVRLLGPQCDLDLVRKEVGRLAEEVADCDVAARLKRLLTSLA
ncbi:MAG: hypothetical protein JKY65_23150 [Planctomycetes bacterium]|nr:hypothetical protein [Planctomycetota bacterium]